jgi:hypothetical protein
MLTFAPTDCFVGSLLVLRFQRLILPRLRSRFAPTGSRRTDYRRSPTDLRSPADLRSRLLVLGSHLLMPPFKRLLILRSPC